MLNMVILLPGPESDYTGLGEQLPPVLGMLHNVIMLPGLVSDYMTGQITLASGNGTSQRDNLLLNL